MIPRFQPGNGRTFSHFTDEYLSEVIQQFEKDGETPGVTLVALYEERDNRVDAGLLRWGIML